MRLREYIEEKAERSVSAVLLRAFGLDPNFEGSEKEIKAKLQKAVSQYPSIIPDFIRKIIKDEKGSRKKGGDE